MKQLFVMINEGNIVEAYEMLISLDGYKDSSDKASSIYDKFNIVEKLKFSNFGDCVFFGTYEQDNDNSNGKEDIEWYVFYTEDERVLLISKYALDCKPYNISKSEVTWASCSLRTWLNDDFINAAFSEEEKAAISTVTVSADKNLEYSTEPGNKTKDKVFLLGNGDAYIILFGSEVQCKPTDYAVANGARVDDNGNCWWWLRSPGINQIFAACVNSDGGVYELGSLVNDDDLAVRPALWIDLNATI